MTAQRDPGPTALKWGSWAFFYGYVGLLIMAGAWGAVLGRVDQRLLFDLEVDRLAPVTEASMLSQYRFLRAIELGFGLWAILHRRDIHRVRAANHLFLFVMTAGVTARLLGLAIDGSPSGAMYFFLATELIGVTLIFAYTRRTLGAAARER